MYMPKALQIVVETAAKTQHWPYLTGVRPPFFMYSSKMATLPMVIGVVEFSRGDSKFERFVSKSQYPHRKLLHFIN
jgi:hypothetical protein